MSLSLARLIGQDAQIPQNLVGLSVTGLTADSRAVKPGFVFAALSGSKVDGAGFITDALAQGAVAIVSNSTGVGPIIHTDNPRRLLALMAARFYGAQPDTTVAVTGTNGKTSVAVFVRQIWEAMGFRAASLGTIGIVGPEGSQYLQNTTPDPVQLHAMLAQLSADHVEHLAIEASSHGLAQHRLDGLRLTAGGFTNLTRDHLDYHHTVEAYFAAKMRLFTELLPSGAGAVINADSDFADETIARCTGRSLRVFTVGHKGTGLKLEDVRSEGYGQILSVRSDFGLSEIPLPLIGTFQASNALVAAGLVIVAGGDAHQVFHALASLKGAPGRLDLVGRTELGAPIFVDYAHTPDALDNALQALRPSTKGNLVVVFGCGGDRDAGKRPLMAQAAAKAADRVYLTDDNPRNEDPANIRKQALAGAPKAFEIGDRAKAILQAVNELQADDVLLVAGKGHEEGQTIGTTVIPFSDHAAVRAAIRGEAYHG